MATYLHSLTHFYRYSPTTRYLSPLHFYLRRQWKTVAYSNPIENKETLDQLIFYACQTIRNRPGTSQKVRQSIIKRLHMCTDLGGGPFEHLL
jgi:hypothetical protein